MALIVALHGIRRLSFCAWNRVIEFAELTKAGKHGIECSMPEADSLRRLVARSIDYAGLISAVQPRARACPGEPGKICSKR